MQSANASRQVFVFFAGHDLPCDPDRVSARPSDVRRLRQEVARDGDELHAHQRPVRLASHPVPGSGRVAGRGVAVSHVLAGLQARAHTRNAGRRAGAQLVLSPGPPEARAASHTGGAADDASRIVAAHTPSGRAGSTASAHARRSAGRPGSELRGALLATGQPEQQAGAAKPARKLLGVAEPRTGARPPPGSHDQAVCDCASSLRCVFSR